MASNIVLVGLASDGPANQAVTVSSLRDLYRTFGGNYTERVFLTPTASAMSLQFTPLNTVSSSWNNKKILYNPYSDNSTFYFGQVGGSGMWVDLTYTPYLGMSDIVAAGQYILENGADSVTICRVGGEKARLLTSDNWYFESINRGDKYNNVVVSSTGSGISIYGLEPNFGRRDYSGIPSRIAAQINQDARLGACPVQVREFSETMSTITATLSGGSNGTLSSAEFSEFISVDCLPTATSHVAVLAPVTENLMTVILNELDEELSQPRMFIFNNPPTLAPINFVGATTSEAALNTYFGAVSTDPFSTSIYTNNQTVTGTLGLQIASTSTPPVFFTRAATGNLSTAVYSLSGALHMSPASSGTVTFSALNNKKIRAFGFWVTEGDRSVRIQGYDGAEAYTPVVGPTTLGSGTPYFIGLGVERPMTHIDVTLDSGSYNHFAIDNLQVRLIDTAGGNMDQVFASIRMLPERSPYVCSIYGDVDVSIAGNRYRRYGVEAVAELINREGGSLTNKGLKAITYRPQLNENEVFAAKANGFCPIVRKIGSGVSIYQGVTTDPDSDYLVTAKTSEIMSVGNEYLLQFMGRPLKEGTQTFLAQELKKKLSSKVSGVAIENVLIDLVDEVLRVLVECVIDNEIMSISFAAQTR